MILPLANIYEVEVLEKGGIQGTSCRVPTRAESVILGLLPLFIISRLSTRTSPCIVRKPHAPMRAIQKPLVVARCDHRHTQRQHAVENLLLQLVVEVGRSLV